MADPTLRQPLGVLPLSRSNHNIQAHAHPPMANKRTYESTSMNAQASRREIVTPTKATTATICGRRSVKRIKTEVEDGGRSQTVNERLGSRQDEEHTQRLKQWSAAYRKLFPTLRFYFDACSEDDVRRCTRSIADLGGVVEPFFSNSVNLLITTRDLPSTAAPGTGVEEIDRSSLLVSHHSQEYKHTKAQSVTASSMVHTRNDLAPRVDIQSHDVLVKAHALGIKIWPLRKLKDSVLKVLLGQPAQTTNQRTLSGTLQAEKYLGANHENVVHFRGPYVLVRDMTELYKPIMCREWPRVSNAKDGEWPQWRNTRPGRCPFIRDKPAEQKKPPLQLTSTRHERFNTLNRFRHAKASGIQQITSAIQSGVGRCGWSGKENIGSGAQGLQNLQKKAVTAQRGTRLNAKADPADHKKGTAELKGGFCENCKDKFDDFDQHLETHTHRSYAKNEDNFTALDSILDVVQRTPRVLVE